ncbi:MAG: hypothetical protein MZW92_57240 [Comamonadaceae bacterium]|nr:hypothetical protein [Comamonadaceae bacterium]
MTAAGADITRHARDFHENPNAHSTCRHLPPYFRRAPLGPVRDRTGDARRARGPGLQRADDAPHHRRVHGCGPRARGLRESADRGPAPERERHRGRPGCVGAGPAPGSHRQRRTPGDPGPRGHAHPGQADRQARDARRGGRSVRRAGRPHAGSHGGYSQRHVLRALVEHPAAVRGSARRSPASRASGRC